MKVHEYQAKALFAKYGVEVPGGRVAATPAEARAIAEELGGKVVVKAQIHAGGRGKGRLVAGGETAAMYERLTTDPGSHEGQVRGDRVGGVRLANTPDEAEREAAAILGRHLVSIQTGPEGKLVKNVLVEEQSAVAREFYLAIIIDGAQAAPLIMASTEGGQEIEVVAANDPDAIVRIPVNAASGYEPYVGRTLAARLGLAGEQAAALNTLVGSLYRAAVESDASLAEINPLVVTEEGRVLALDAKFTVDDNALFRHKDLAELRDKDEEDRLEVLADDLGVANFIKLDGNIGCIVNGAGLAMATMDTIKFAGGEPANFLDIVHRERPRARRERHPRDQRGPLGEGDPRQHLRGHGARRHHRPGRHQCGEGARAGRARGDAAGRHEPGRGRGAARRGGPRRHPRGEPRRGRGRRRSPPPEPPDTLVMR